MSAYRGPSMFVFVALFSFLAMTVSATAQDYYVHDEGYMGSHYAAFDGEHVRIHHTAGPFPSFLSSVSHTIQKTPVVTAFPRALHEAVWSFREFDRDAGGDWLSVVHVRWHADDITDYVSWGRTIHEYEYPEFGIPQTDKIITFLSGPEFRTGREWAPDSVPLPLTGQVIYQGTFSGFFRTSSTSAELEADAFIIVNFTTGGIDGCVGCGSSYGTRFTPVDYNTATGSVDRSLATHTNRMAIQLQTTSFMERPWNLGFVEHGDARVDDGSTWDGRWHGQLSSIPDADGNPRSVGLIITAQRGHRTDSHANFDAGFGGVVIANSPDYIAELEAADAGP